jgi:hypothetical protein
VNAGRVAQELDFDRASLLARGAKSDSEEQERKGRFELHGSPRNSPETTIILALFVLCKIAREPDWQTQAGQALVP